jgi:hypothetical protein
LPWRTTCTVDRCSTPVSWRDSDEVQTIGLNPSAAKTDKLFVFRLDAVIRWCAFASLLVASL